MFHEAAWRTTAKQPEARRGPAAPGHVHAEGVRVHRSPLGANIIDANLRVRHTAAEARLWVRLVLDLPITPCRTYAPQPSGQLPSQSAGQSKQRQMGVGALQRHTGQVYHNAGVGRTAAHGAQVGLSYCCASTSEVARRLEGEELGPIEGFRPITISASINKGMTSSQILWTPVHVMDTAGQFPEQYCTTPQST